MALLSQQDINNFDKQWTIKIGSVLMDLTEIEATKWDDEKDPNGKSIALKVQPCIYPHMGNMADIRSGRNSISKVQRMISDTPPGCLWGVNYLRIPMTPQGKAIAQLILDAIDDYEDWCRDMSEAFDPYSI